MERPNYNSIPITDARTYLTYSKNVITVNWEKYAKDLDQYIDHLERALANVGTSEKDLTGMRSYNQPFVGGYFSPYETGNAMVLLLVKEDEDYWYFSDRSKFPKVHSWSWFRREKPIEIIETDEPFVFPYESYSLWSRQLAETYTLQELNKVANECEFLSDKYAKQHLSAIEATTSMQSQSQRRSQSKNNVTGNYEKKQAYLNAIELHQYYPTRCKQPL